MTADPKPYNRTPAPPAAGALRESFDESCARQESGWRLLQGPEPHRIICQPVPPPFLRYAPYREAQ